MMKNMDLERVLRDCRHKYGDIPIKIKYKDDAFLITDISVYEIEGFNYTVIEVEEE